MSLVNKSTRILPSVSLQYNGIYSLCCQSWRKHNEIQTYLLFPRCTRSNAGLVATGQMFEHVRKVRQTILGRHPSSTLVNVAIFFCWTIVELESTSVWANGTNAYTITWIPCKQVLPLAHDERNVLLKLALIHYQKWFHLFFNVLFQHDTGRHFARHQRHELGLAHDCQVLLQVGHCCPWLQEPYILGRFVNVFEAFVLSENKVSY